MSRNLQIDLEIQRWHCIYILDAEGAAFEGQPSEAGLSMLIFDANGEQHGRSEAGFKRGGLSLREVNNLQSMQPSELSTKY